MHHPKDLYWVEKESIWLCWFCIEESAIENKPTKGDTLVNYLIGHKYMYKVWKEEEVV